MADPSTYRPAPGEVPTSPGVYRFLNPDGRVIYVGKAKNLRQRLANYFQNIADLHPRTQTMVTTACAVEWTVVSNEVEALALEYSWIKEFNPRFNVIFKDDKSYPYLAVSMADTYPRVQVYRGARKASVRYFGPFVATWSLRDTLDKLLRVFPMRSCSAGVFRRAQAQDRPCLLGYIDKCAAPCVGKVSPEEHRQIAEDLCSFMSGRTGPYLRQLREDMAAAAAELNFEKAARLRDDIAALDTIIERNAVVLPDAVDCDTFALVRDELHAAVQVFHVRGGRVRGQRGWVIDLIDDPSDAQLMTRLLTQVYSSAGATSASPASPEQAQSGSPSSPEEVPDAAPQLTAPASGTPSAPEPPQAPRSGPATMVGLSERSPSAPAPRVSGQPERSDQQPATSVDDVAHTATTAIPRDILVSVMPEDATTLSDWLREQRGGAVNLRVPQRGEKASLMETVRKNAEEALRLHKTRRASDITARSQALEELAEALDLEEAPLRIECYDISHTQGTHQVGSMVVFDDAAPRRSDYRHYTIRGEHGDGARDDTEAMREVLTRRFSRLAREEQDAAPVHSGEIEASTPKPARFSYTPGLIVVDGGLPQVNAAAAVLEELQVTIPVVGLAKRLEEIWVPGEEFPVILPRTSPALYLLQHLRDESHRVAISHHRKKRSQGMTRSTLDAIPGLGPARQKALLQAFGSLTALRAADAEEIASVRGIGPQLASTIVEYLRTHQR